MEKTSTATILTLALLTGPFFAGGALAKPNDEQTGRSVDCTYEDGLIPFLLGLGPDEGAQAFATAYQTVTPTQTVDVDGGTAFDLWTEEGGPAHIHFFDAENNNVGWSSGSGTAPDEAVRGIVCVPLEEAPTDRPKILPNPATVYHYQDGLDA